MIEGNVHFGGKTGYLYEPARALELTLGANSAAGMHIPKYILTPPRTVPLGNRISTWKLYIPRTVGFTNSCLGLASEREQSSRLELSTG